jgi:hypothetical protein
VYAVVRRKRKGFGPDDLTIDTRIAQALLISVLLSSAYVALGWAWLDGLAIIDGETVTIVNPLGLGLTVLVACALVPAGLAWLLNLPYEIRRWREGDTGWKLLWRWKLERTIRASSIPTAWDAAASRPHHRMVRVQFPDGRWIGGFYGPGSFVSTFPQPRDIYISHQYEMSEDGQFLSPLERTGGVWLRIRDEHIVEFLWPNYTPEDLHETDDGGSREGAE